MTTALKTTRRDFLIYLAGPVTGLNYGQGQSWRDYVAENLPVEIRAMSPLRAQQGTLERVGVIHDSYEDDPLTSAAGITTRDRFDCMRADAVLVNFLGATTVSVGTCIELGWADAHRVPIIMAIEPQGNPHEHPMVRHITGFRTLSLDEAIEVATAILMPEGRGTAREILPPDYLKTRH